MLMKGRGLSWAFAIAPSITAVTVTRTLNLVDCRFRLFIYPKTEPLCGKTFFATITAKLMHHIIHDSRGRSGGKGGNSSKPCRYATHNIASVEQHDLILQIPEYFLTLPAPCCSTIRWI